MKKMYLNDKIGTISERNNNYTIISKENVNTGITKIRYSIVIKYEGPKVCNKRYLHVYVTLRLAQHMDKHVSLQLHYFNG